MSPIQEPNGYNIQRKVIRCKNSVMQKGHHIEWKIISHKLSENATEQEEQLLRQWLEADESHRIYFERAKEAWNTEIQPPAFDCENGFRELSAQLKHPSRPLYKTVISYAAVLTLLLTLACGYLLLHEDKQEPTTGIPLSEYIHPGKVKATLILNDGKKIALENSDVELNIKGVIVRNDTNNNLRYDAPANGNAEYNRLVVPRGGEYCVTLADGSTVWLNSGSELWYPTLFSGTDRKVVLKGEAYFKVAHNDKMPFIVEAGGCQVEVLGTEFNLCAYPDDENQTATLIQGKVKVNVIGGPDSETLLPDMQFVYNTINRETKILQVNTDYYTAWRNGQFEFRNVPFGEFLRVVARWYNFNYKVLDTTLLDYHLTGSFLKSDNIEDLFRILNSVKMPVDIKFTDGILLFSKKSNDTNL